MATDFVARLAAEGWELIAPIEDTECDFNPYPAFGLACATCNWEILETFSHTY